MKPLKIMVALAVLAILPFVAAGPSLAQERFPRPTGAVNDFAGVIPAEERQQMEHLAREVLEKTGTSLVVVTVAAIGDHEFKAYVNRLYSAWGIGKKGEDKGVLIALTLKERKLWIETGYGVEGILPDGLVGEIRDRTIIPRLRAGDYGRGLADGMSAIAAIVAKDAGVTLGGQPRAGRPGASKARGGEQWILWTAVLLALLFLLGTPRGRDLLPWILYGLLSGGGRGYDGGHDYGGGGFGDFGGGGFDGFGGGSSGGGGAGGDF